LDSAKKQRLKPCYGLLRCWNQIQVQCPVYSECRDLAGNVRMLDKVKQQNKRLRSLMDVSSQEKSHAIPERKVNMNEGI